MGWLNAYISGTLGVTASASDHVGVVKVGLYIDGRLVAADTAEPFSFTWDTTQTPDGQHILQAKAYDGAGNSSLSSPLFVTVQNNGTDTTPPDVSITSPADETAVTRTIKIKARANDNREVQQVTVFVDGSALSSVNCGVATCSIQVSWNPRSYVGWHALTASASGAAGNEETSNEVWVRVK